MKVGKTIAFIEARCGSTRLPKKVLKKILNRPMLELMIERVKHSSFLDGIVVATSMQPKDDLIEKLALKIGVNCFRGSENDVLSRVLQAALKYKADYIVELWGDCPLIDSEIIDGSICYFKQNDFDLIGTSGINFGKRNYPLGMSLLIFPTRILKEISCLTNDPIDRENVSNYIYEHPDKYKMGLYPCPKHLQRSDLRLVVDERADFELVKTIFNNLYPKKKIFSCKDIIEFLDKNPELKDLNKNIKQNFLKEMRSRNEK